MSIKKDGAGNLYPILASAIPIPEVRSIWKTVELLREYEKHAADYDTTDIALDLEQTKTNSIHVFHKTGTRTVYDEARERNDDVGDVLLTNCGGEVTELTIACV